jgi:hypothetical protein
MVRSSIPFAALCLILTGADAAEVTPQYTYSIRGPCGQVIDGLPGTVYDDGTGGGPDFEHGRPGQTWDVVLTVLSPVPVPNDPCTVGFYRWALGVEGSLSITDITTDGTVSCEPVFQGPQCEGWSGDYLTELTGPPFGAGPQTDDNHGALSEVFLGVQARGLGDGTHVVARIRVSGQFPDFAGEEVRGRLFFTTRTGSPQRPTSPRVANFCGGDVTPSDGNPPLLLEDCDVILRAKSSADLVRCDANADGRLDISDAVWILRELFRGGAQTACREAADCDGDGERNVSDGVYGVTYLFAGGPAPPAPFPDCAPIAGLPTEDCPLGTTNCP